MPFSMAGRPYLHPIYNAWHPRMVVIGGRQIEKSTLLSNLMLMPAAARRGFRSLLVNPTDTHTKTFAYDKLEGTINASPYLQKILGKTRIDNLKHKEWMNGSSILLRSAYLTARSARGIPADQLLIDEAQDMIPDHLPVLAETLTHSHDSDFGRRIVIGGTALIPECMIGEYWAEYSTQGEWVVKCPAGHDNIIEIDNLSEKGIICTHKDPTGTGCGKLVDPTNGRWVHLFPERRDKGLYVGYRIPQVINPMVHSHWEEIVTKLNTYSNSRIHQEVLGRSYEVGTQPISKSDLVRAEKDVEMSEKLEFFENAVMGIDWGYGDVSYSVVTIGGWNQRQKWQVIYAKKYKLGEEIDPVYQLNDILRLVQKFKVVYIGCDWGAGWGQNARLKAKFPRTADFIYSHGQKTKLKWSQSVNRYTANRTETMTDLFESIKMGNVEFFKGFTSEFGQDFLNVRGTLDTMGRVMYTHKTSLPDDAVHAVSYGHLIGRIMRKDIQPLLEE